MSYYLKFISILIKKFLFFSTKTDKSVGYLNFVNNLLTISGSSKNLKLYRFRRHSNK